MLMRTRQNRFLSAPKGAARLSAALLSLATLYTSVAEANVVGADTQNFNPTTSGLDFVTVESAQTLDPGVINFGLFLNEAENTLPYFSNDRQSRQHYSDSLLSADLNIGVGLLPGFDIGVSAPQELYQTTNGSADRGQFAAPGNTEVAINAKYQFFGTHEYGLALELSENLNRINDDPYAGKNAGPTTNLQMAGDVTLGGFKLGLNAGYRWRQPGEKLTPDSQITPLPNQYIASAALSYLISSIDTKLILEVYGSVPDHSVTDASDRLASSAETLIGLKHDFTTNLAGHAGFGTELINGISSPDWRLYCGVNYSIGPTFSKPKPQRVEAAAAPVAVKADPFAGPPRAKEKIVIHDILFEYDSDKLTVGGGDETIHRLVDYLNTKPAFTRLVIEGHTDSVGSDPYNLALSRRRAETIRKWLIDRYHLPADKIVAIGRGKRMPIADNGNYQGRQLNRRVEFTIYRNMAPAK